MTASNKVHFYFYIVVAVVGISIESFLRYDKTHKAIWLIPGVICGVAFFAISIDLFRWWAKVYRGEK